jgi:hypothetical protein
MGTRASDWRRSTDDTIEYRGHRLIADRVFFTLPEDLLKAADDAIVGPQRLVSGIEIALSRVCGDHSQHVGFCNAVPIAYPYLRRRAATSVVLDDAAHKLLARQILNAREKLQTAERRLKRHFNIAKAYAGWLLTQPTYVEEQDNLLREFHHDVSQWGLPNLARQTTSIAGSELPISPVPAPHVYVHRFEAFYLRWRLSGLAAPNLPLPIPPQTPAPAAILAAGPMNDVGALFYLPDTYPVPSRDELRVMLEDALHGVQEGVEHLAGWINLIRGGNTAKNAITRFGRILEIQHYCRILEERHSDHIKRRQGHLERAIAKFLKVSADTVHKDLLLIRQRLGKAWMSRGNNVAPPS